MGFRVCGRDMDSLMPPSILDWVASDDFVRFVEAMAERVPLSEFVLDQRGTGSDQYHPRILLAVMVFCYGSRIFSSRKIEQATYDLVPVRFAAGNSHPDHATIAKFRRENREAIAEAFVNGLQLARAMGLLRLGTITVGGTKIEADASYGRTLTYEQAEAADEPLPEALPAAPEEQMDREFRRLEEQARTRAAQAHPAGMRRSGKPAARKRLRRSPWGTTPRPRNRRTRARQSRPRPLSSTSRTRTATGCGTDRGAAAASPTVPRLWWSPTAT